jgi:dTDP-6-deoxy-L-talose 4-dehydrogenase (NAD+)
MKNLLITGVTGFIGSNLLDKISSENFKILALIRKENVLLSNKYPNIEFIITSLEEISIDFFIEKKIDILVHFAWSNVSKVMLDSHLNEEFELQKTFLKKALDCGVTKLIISGSCFEYGKIEGGIDVDCTPLPNTNYGIAKNNLRIWIEDYINQLKLNVSVIWLRIFYAYGNGQHERSLYSQLLKAIKNSEKEFNMSHGKQIRDFISVDEIAMNVSDILFTDYQYGVKIINICSGSGISVKDFVEMVISQNDIKLKLNLGYYSVPEYEPLAFWGIK